MNKILVYIALFCAMTFRVSAQQDAQYTQFMHHKLTYNPAYAGNSEGASVTALYRSQWISLEGAPSSQLLSANIPLVNNRVGVGVNLVRNSIGISDSYTADGIYAYRTPLGRGTLAIGVQASVRKLLMNFSDPRVIATNGVAGDQAIPGGLQSKFFPNFGMGVYYSTSRYYFGLSVPRLLKNNLNYNNGQTIIDREVQHIYAMAGTVFKVAPDVHLQPQFLLKYAQGAPFDADFNLNAIFFERYTAGLSYRLGGSKSNGIGESVDLLVSAQLSNKLFFGLGYDVTLTGLGRYNSGSAEAIFRYAFSVPEGDDYINPRFF
jgi:type IX secretion system PorP/SprF family membrane protein